MSGDFFSKFEPQLEAAAGRAIASGADARVRRVRSRRLAIVLAALITVGGGAAAATDLLRVGTDVPVETIGGKHEPTRLGPRIVVATGRTPIMGRWQMYWSRSSAGDCLALEFLDPGPGGAAGLGEGCGAPSGLTAGALVPIPGAPQPAETVIHGRAPEDTARVRVSVPGLGSRDTDAEDGPAEAPGDWYLVAFPGVPRAGTATVEVLDEDGEPQGRATELPISLHPRYDPPIARYVGGRTLAVSSGGLARVPLDCRRQRRRQGKCMGTVSLSVAGERDADCGPVAGRACPQGSLRYGWQYFRLSPGTRHRVIHIRLTDASRRRLRREGRLRAQLRDGASRVPVTLVAR